MGATVGGIGATWRFRIAKPFCYDIHDGRHSSHLEALQLSAYAVVCCLLTMILSSSVCLSATLHFFAIYIRIISMMAANCYLSDGAETCWKGIGAAWRFRIAKMVLFCYPRWNLFHSDIQDGGHSGRHWGNMEIQNC